MKYRDEFLPDEVEYPHLATVKRCMVANETYRVYYAENGKYTHIRIIRLDKEPIMNFMDMQEIKNDLLGAEVEAIQVFPKESNMINGSNTYHMWSWEGLDTPNLKALYTYNDNTQLL